MKTLPQKAAATNIFSSKNVSMIDVGTGAGFPAIPLKIACPNIQLTLLDSLSKRIKFLDDVITSINLNGITTIHSRAEEGGRNKDLRDNFDIAVSRAVASLNVLTEYCLPYVKVGGLFISYKSQDIEEELESSKRAIKLLGGELEDVINFQLADSDISRSFVLIRKTKPTPKAYPRKPGTAKKEPL
jgi:16S rRNA m(7)G-527 methyltransferase (EC 2.1.1.-)